MENNEMCTTLDYEAEYYRAMEEIAKAKCEIANLRDELKQMERTKMWLIGIKDAIEVVFGREFNG